MIEILNKQMTRKEFLKYSGIFVLFLLVAPSLISTVFEKKENNFKNNQLYIDGHLVMEVK